VNLAATGGGFPYCADGEFREFLPPTRNWHGGASRPSPLARDSDGGDDSPPKASERCNSWAGASVDRRFRERLPPTGIIRLDVVTIGFSLGRKPKGGAGRNRLPFDSQSASPRLTYGSSRCHSCRKLNYLARDRHAHNPKVAGSNPAPATKPINYLHLASSFLPPRMPIRSRT
jgi:hypothetical protein